MSDKVATSALRHPLLERLGIVHGFGTRSSVPPEAMIRPIQVHGVDVMRVHVPDAVSIEADAIVCDLPGQPVGILTADCVPILACSEGGEVVAAIHAGWRGLAAGVVENGIEALRETAPSGAPLYAVMGPHIGRCCYEVDSPVLDAMRSRFRQVTVANACVPTRPGHAMIELAALVDAELVRIGISDAFRSRIPDSCTGCSQDRFHSFRRAGEAAGRMAHHIATSQN